MTNRESQPNILGKIDELLIDLAPEISPFDPLGVPSYIGPLDTMHWDGGKHPLEREAIAERSTQEPANQVDTPEGSYPIAPLSVEFISYQP